MLIILLASAFLLMLTAISSIAMGEDDQDEEEEEDPTFEETLEDASDTIKNDELLVIMGVVGITSLIIYIPMGIRAKQIRDMEDALPDVLNEIAENIRSGRSVESAFKEVADVRIDRLGWELKRASEEMLNTSFAAAMTAFAMRTGSRAIIRIISLVLIAVESGASLASVLEKIANELWGVYILKKDREAKSSTNASVILWGGAVFTPAIIGFILGIFTTRTSIDLDMSDFTPVFELFLMLLGFISIIMHGVAMGVLKQDLVRSPFFTWLPGFVYILVQETSGAFM